MTDARVHKILNMLIIAAVAVACVAGLFFKLFAASLPDVPVSSF